MEIPWQGKSLSANYYKSTGANRNNRLIVGLCGFDSIQEELYFIYVREALERGYDVLTYDGPGQGSSIRNKGIVFTSDWEKPNTAVIDHLIAHKGAPAKIILLGNSFGSLLGTRAAAADSRIDALICFDVFYDYGDVALWDFPQSTRTMIDEYPDKKIPWISQKISSLIMHKDPKIRWALSHGMWVMGLESEMDVLKEYTRYTNKDIAHKVNCDVLLMSCAEDHLIPAPLAEKCKNSLENARSLTHIHYTRESDGYLHCRVGALNALYETMFPWMDSLR